jgi:hypothetical protein
MSQHSEPALGRAPDTTPLPKALAELIGLKRGRKGQDDWTEPSTQLDWALLWAEQGAHVFPCEQHLGTPLIKSWYGAATTCRKTIIDWWSEHPAADIGAVPDKSGHYVIAVHADEGGYNSLRALEAEHGRLPYDGDLCTENRCGDAFYWLKGQAFTSHHKLGRGLHVLGAGMRLFMPNSYAPHLNYAEE